MAPPLEHGSDAAAELHGVRYGGKRHWGAGGRAIGPENWNTHEQVDEPVRTFPVVCVYNKLLQQQQENGILSTKLRRKKTFTANVPFVILRELICS